MRFNAWAHCYETFYDRNLRIFEKSHNICPWQVFPASSNVCEKGQEPTQVKYILIVLLYGKLQLNLQTLDKARKTCQEKHSS